MCNGLVKYLIKENGITKEEAEKMIEERKKYRGYFKDEEKKYKTIPINPDKFEDILIRIGRKKKQNSKKEIKEVNENENYRITKRKCKES